MISFKEKRIIKQEMINWLDSVLEYRLSSDPTTLFRMLLRTCEMKIKEDGGDNQGKIVSWIQDTIGNAQGEAWCLGFIETLVAYVEHKLGYICYSLPPTESCHDAFDWIKENGFETYNPLAGDLMWFDFGNRRGHVEGIVIAGTFKHSTIGGNTSDSSGSDPSQREGDGVFAKIRNAGDIGSMKLLGYSILLWRSV